MKNYKKLQHITFDDYFDQQLQAFIETLDEGEFTFNLINVANRNPSQIPNYIWKDLIYIQSKPFFYN